MNFGPVEILVVLLLALLLFGAKKLPELGKGLGQGIREFRKGTRELRGDIEDSLRDDEPRRDRAVESRPVESRPVENRSSETGA